MSQVTARLPANHRVALHRRPQPRIDYRHTTQVQANEKRASLVPVCWIYPSFAAFFSSGRRAWSPSGQSMPWCRTVRGCFWRGVRPAANLGNIASPCIHDQRDDFRHRGTHYGRAHPLTSDPAQGMFHAVSCSYPGLASWVLALTLTL